MRSRINGAAGMSRRGFMRRSAAGLGGAMAMSPGVAGAAQTARQTMSLNVIYPNRPGARFDMAYYRTRHIPLAMRVMRADSVTLIEGVPTGDTPPPYVMICHFEFASAEALAVAVARPEMAEVRADVANFTDITQTVMMGKS